jgi:hypothetical protein
MRSRERPRNAVLWDMTSYEVISQAYSAFNRRDIDGALALMSESVSWPKASEGGRVVGKQAIREYWTRQWAEFDPRVDPLAIVENGNAFEVRVHQVVKALDGEILSDSEVLHVYTMSDGLIERMDVGGADSAGEPTAAFSR